MQYLCLWEFIGAVLVGVDVETLEWQKIQAIGGRRQRTNFSWAKIGD